MRVAQVVEPNARREAGSPKGALEVPLDIARHQWGAHVRTEDQVVVDPGRGGVALITTLRERSMAASASASSPRTGNQIRRPNRTLGNSPSAAIS
jgi:hypothetical protein